MTSEKNDDTITVTGDYVLATHERQGDATILTLDRREGGLHKRKLFGGEAARQMWAILRSALDGDANGQG